MSEALRLRLHPRLMTHGHLNNALQHGPSLLSNYTP